MEYLDSSGLGLLLSMSKEYAVVGGRLVLVTNETVDNILSLTRLNGIFATASTLDEALQVLGHDTPAGHLPSHDNEERTPHRCPPVRFLFARCRANQRARYGVVGRGLQRLDLVLGERDVLALRIELEYRSKAAIALAVWPELA